MAVLAHKAAIYIFLKPAVRARRARDAFMLRNDSRVLASFRAFSRPKVFPLDSAQPRQRNCLGESDPSLASLAQDDDGSGDARPDDRKTHY
jgi:hypothetical protein